MVQSKEHSKDRKISNSNERLKSFPKEDPFHLSRNLPLRLQNYNVHVFTAPEMSNHKKSTRDVSKKVHFSHPICELM